eukprot:TRINITY_DN11935_c0_g1_i1.p1 TRINITY_DN11935_c0_g1~~TRINITY_DN11935_c0_g1_i1.p1  ORF type:complete len:454 (-),score=86.84 TRINITY_DN11935_c0_g1_i1:93-1454(-)
MKARKEGPKPVLWEGGFEEALRSGLFSDVTIVDLTSSLEYKLHRVVLTRKSAYFKKLFLGGWKEGTLNRVEITDTTGSFGSIVEYIYTGKITVTPENVSSLLDASEVFLVEGLTKYILDLIQEQLDSEKDMIFLYFNRGKESRLASSDYIMNNFSDLVASGCFERLKSGVLSPEGLVGILEQDELASKKEDDVLVAVIEYCKGNPGLTALQKRGLFGAPRYSFVRTELLLACHTEYREFLPAAFQDVLVSRVCRGAGIHVPHSLASYKHRGKGDTIQFTQTVPTDFKGLFYWLGQGRGMTSWENPLSKKEIVITSSSAWGGASPNPSVVTLGNTVPDSVFFWTNSEQNAWVVFDIDPNETGLRFSPSSYVFGFLSSTWMPRNWNFEASNDKATWKVIKNHTNDQTITTAGNFVFEVDDLSEGFRYFKLALTGPDSNGSFFLGFTGFEMFGKVM